MVYEETVSVSKGVFVFKNGFKKSRRTSKKTVPNSADNMFSHNLWYQEYMALWSSLNAEFETLTSDIFTSMTADLLDFVKMSHQNEVNEIPTAALLTGINMPDHEAQFRSLQMRLRTDITPHVAFLKSQDCASLKYLIDSMINQFIIVESDDSYQEDDSRERKSYFKKSVLNLPLLKSWYEDLYPPNDIAASERKLLVVILPDFESFNVKVLQRFILILSCYLEKLPFVFIFGIATSLTTLHSSFPYHVTSKTNIRVFKCQPSTQHLNTILENVFLSPFCPFQLGGKVFDLFTEIFLYYDFSVRNFVQNIKYAMMEHFCYGNAMALCQIEKKDVKELLNIFTHADCENIRQLLSFRKLVESESHINRILLLTNDDYFKQIVFDGIVNLQRYIKRLHIFLKCLHILVGDLPGYPLGKNLRELYALAVTKDIIQSAEYKEAFQLLGFQSKEELNTKLAKISNTLEEFINEGSKKTQLKDFHGEINKFREVLSDVDSLNLETEELQNEEMECGNSDLNKVNDRRALKEMLRSRSNYKSKQFSRYDKLRQEILDFLSQHFQIFLKHPSSLPFYEIFFFDDVSIKNKIIGTHRSAIHNALNDPCYYLLCKCCEVNNSQSIKATMPDVCIAYKLHLECGKMINLYDWFQAFRCIVDPKAVDDCDDKSKEFVNPEVQARFTQAVAELEYLGFIKSSKRKADHVTRLTWGG